MLAACRVSLACLMQSHCGTRGGNTGTQWLKCSLYPSGSCYQRLRAGRKRQKPPAATARAGARPRRGACHSQAPDALAPGVRQRCASRARCVTCSCCHAFMSHVLSASRLQSEMAAQAASSRASQPAPKPSDPAPDPAAGGMPDDARPQPVKRAQPAAKTSSASLGLLS